MSKLKILILEDSKLDTELIIKELEKDGFNFDFIRVETEEGFTKNLSNYKPDIILSDFSLPQFDGMSALKIAVKHYPQTPFIVVTGSLSEEVAADCIKSGAWDYVVKERLFRLGSVLKNTLELKKEKENFLEAEETRKKYEFIINTSKIPMSLINLDYRYEAVNDAYCRMHGLSRKKMINYSVEDIWHKKEHIDYILPHLKNAFSGTEVNYETWFTTHNKGLRFFNVSLSPYYTGEKISHVVVTSHDLTENKIAEKELRKFSTAVEQSPGPVIITDINGKIEYVNSKFTELTGYTLKESVGKNPNMLKTGHTDQNEYKNLWNTIKAGKVWKGEFKNKKKNGEIYWESTTISPIINENGETTNYIALKEDITTRKKAEQDLLESERRIRTIMDYSPIAILQQDYTVLKKYLNKMVKERELDLNLLTKNKDELRKCLSMVKLLDMNKAAKEILNATSVKEIEKNRAKIYTADTMKNFAQGLVKLTKEENYYQFETTINNLKGEPKHCIVRLATIPGHEDKFDLVIMSLLDITLRLKAEEQLKESLAEKEIMLKEIHHRVKNNLQIISSLLNMQIRYLKNESAREYLQESHNRVKSMALIHENLYQSKNLREIDFSNYIDLLINHLFSSYNDLNQSITYQLDISNIFLNINIAIPLGLIINELVTNSLKYAFTGLNEGLVLISMKKHGDKYLLVISDNGIGIDKDLDPESIASLGLQLVRALTKQIHAQLELIRNKGTTFRLTFKETDN